MSVGLFLTGTYGAKGMSESPEEWLDRVAAWLEARDEEPVVRCFAALTELEQPCLVIAMYPGTEEVELAIPGKGVCQVAATTSMVGPGYHVFLCQLLQSLGNEFDIRWDEPDQVEGIGDETGYFHGGTADQVREAMLNWLSGLAGRVLEEMGEPEQAIQVALAPGHRFGYPAEVLTPLGPRSRDWFAAAAEAPERGFDFFPWWDEGVTASYYLGRAMTLIWTDVRWREPVNEEESELLNYVHADLEKAYALDATMTMPWREWVEIMDLLQQSQEFVDWEGENLEEKIRALAATEQSGERMGYRRWPVTVELAGGWLIDVPGEFSEQWDEEGENWNAGLGDRNVWFSWVEYETEEEDGAQGPEELLAGLELPEGTRSLEYAEEELVGKATLLKHEEAEGTVWQLRAVSAVSGTLAVLNVFFKAEADLEWAVETWHSLRNEAEE